jgi:hypothetical protein
MTTNDRLGAVLRLNILVQVLASSLAVMGLVPGRLQHLLRNVTELAFREVAPARDLSEKLDPVRRRTLDALLQQNIPSDLNLSSKHEHFHKKSSQRSIHRVRMSPYMKIPPKGRRWRFGCLYQVTMQKIRYIFSGAGMPRRWRPFSMVVTNARASARLYDSCVPPTICSLA